ncbi:hypothetical protein M8J76_010138 [Diaphorina citri]|nr:hypothetical protein M8J75_013368 [Diaphorina citri]KAI5719437.1 hypothetical protein M8J76_010138 [Diaphorina citri]KAI5720050.1 hypothetical protein M8J77_001155 [Diaphorina citri]
MLTKRTSSLLLLILLSLILLIVAVQGEQKPVAGKAKCHLKPVTGNCRASLHRYYFDTKTLTCTSFIYGGCGGNANNFVKRKDCERQCAKYFTKHHEKG